MAISMAKEAADSRRRARWTVTAAIIVVGGTALGVFLGLVRGSSTEAHAAESAPAVIEPVAGTDLARITLSARAMKRLEVRTDAVRIADVDGKPQSVVPYSSVLYSPDGKAWVYTSPKPRIFIRQSITIDSIDGLRAVLSAGPAPGTRVATVGVAELFGAESGLG